MSLYKGKNSLKKNFLKSKKNTTTNISLLNLKIIHKILDSINTSLLILVLVLSFLSFNSQRKWTNIYRNLDKTRTYNNNLIDYISKTEEFYIYEIESLDTLKKTTPKDLIYLVRQITKQKNNYINKKIKDIYDGLKSSKYQRGY